MAADTVETVGQSYLLAADSDEEREQYADFREHWNDYLATLRVVFRRLEAGEITAAHQEFNLVSLASFDSAIGKLDDLIRYTKTRADHAVALADEAYGRAIILIVASIVAAGAGVLVAIIWVSRSITAPILSISNAMRRLTSGEEAVIPVGGPERNDEIGVLIAAASSHREALLRVRQLAREAETERERLNAAISNMPIGLSMFDAEQRLIVCNDRYASVYKIPAELRAPGITFEEILQARVRAGAISETEFNDYMARIARVLRERQPSFSVVELRNGCVLSVAFQPMENGGWVATHEDITDRRRAEERIHHMARYDGLTDLPNRTHFVEKIEAALKRVSRGESVAILCLDLDHFKSVNDTLGHPIGDQLLMSVADRLRACIREGDSVARFGGDEFSVVQVDIDQPEGATALAQRIIDTLSVPYEVGGHQVVIGASVGISVAPADGQTAEQLLKNSDMALYRAKNDGRGTYRFFEPEMDARMQARRTLELDLRRALMQREFEIYYQPLVNPVNNDVTGFEALLRWHHPERGLVSPAQFIGLAEEIGLIVPLGEWVLRQACSDAATWPDDIRVAVNLSPAQFKSKKLVEAVINALAVSRLPARRLELEITENVLLGDSEVALTTLHQLRALGAHIAMDDFGTGYSSLSYLRQFPYDKIKIDGSFVRNIDNEKSSLAIIRAVTGLSTSLGIATTAEGVETKEQFDRLRSEGCVEVQGFYISEARPANEIGALLRTLRRQREAAA